MTISLDTAISGLKAAQRSLEQISTNIANANTDGYTRKILPQETLMVGGLGAGVKLTAIRRNVDSTLVRDLTRQNSVTQNYTVKEQFLSRIQDFHGASEAERSISSRIGQLADAFAELSISPDNNITLNKTLVAAQETARTFNDFSQLLTTMRNEAEAEIESAVDVINQQLDLISELNIKISIFSSQGKSFADLEDQRDLALKEISKYMEISTFPQENNKIVVMTRQGHLLADTTPRTVSFTKSNVIPTSYYPGGGLNGFMVEDVELEPADIGGRIGALFELRDDTLPRYQAQIDEMAQKLAIRLEQQGLRLFTDLNGNVPPSVADPAPVSYVGFAAEIRVNDAVVNDVSLLRQGTTGATILPGSNEVVRKISEFAFGTYAYQEATGTVDISAGTIFAATGLTQSNQLIGNVDLSDYLPDLGAAPNITPPASFQLTIGVTPYVINIAPGDTATDLVNTINTAVGSTVADLNGLGQLRLNTTADITLTDITIGAAGMAELGFSFGVTPAQNPSFTVQVGTQSPVTISVAPGDTAVNLLASLNTISGLTATLGGGGELVLTPTTGGDITIQNVVGQPLQSLGMSMTNVAHDPLRQYNLGPSGTLSTGVLANGTIEDYARNVVSAQSQDHNLTVSRLEKEESFYNTLDQRLNNQSGVDIDEELSNLIRIQTAYAASARMISATEELLDDLLNAFIR